MCVSCVFMFLLFSCFSYALTVCHFFYFIAHVTMTIVYSNRFYSQSCPCILQLHVHRLYVIAVHDRTPLFIYLFILRTSALTLGYPGMFINNAGITITITFIIITLCQQQPCDHQHPSNIHVKTNSAKQVNTRQLLQSKNLCVSVPEFAQRLRTDRLSF